MHTFAIVLVRPGEGEDAVKKLMAPWDENDGWPNNGWWDWWTIGGRWDGKVRGHDDACPECDEDWRHRSAAAHHTWERNSVPVREMGEVTCLTIITPDGLAYHQRVWVPEDKEWMEDTRWAETSARLLLAHRDCVAVGVDYHS